MLLTSAQIFKKDKRYLNNFGLEFIGGKKGSCRNATAQFRSGWIDKYNHLVGRTFEIVQRGYNERRSRNIGTALIFWFVLDQAKMNRKLFRHNNTWIERT